MADARVRGGFLRLGEFHPPVMKMRSLGTENDPKDETTLYLPFHPTRIIDS